MALLFSLAITLSQIAIVVCIIIVAILFLAVCYVAQDDAELEAQRQRREGEDMMGVDS